MMQNEYDFTKIDMQQSGVPYYCFKKGIQIKWKLQSQTLPLSYFVYYIKLPDGEAFALEFCVMRSTSLLPLLPGPLWT